MTEIILNKISLEGLLSFPQEKFIHTLHHLMLDKNIGYSYKLSGINYAIIIKPTNSNDYKDLTNINFDECEKIIRKKNVISDSSILTILQIEIENDNNQSLINQVEYKIYDEKKNSLDISICKNIDIIINYSMKNLSLSLIDQNLFLEFKNLNINIFLISMNLFLMIYVLHIIITILILF